MTEGAKEHVDVLVVGGGPAGLATAVALRARGVERVLVAERAGEAGGFARRVPHLGFGLRDLRRCLTGVDYARAWRDLARDAGVQIATGSSVDAWISRENVVPITVCVAGLGGPRLVVARAVVLATGARERTRSARLVPGARPLGVLTSGSLADLVRRGERPGKRAVVVGAEHVSFAATQLLAAAGSEVAALVTDAARHQTWKVVAWGIARRRGIPIRVEARVTRILGRGRVDAVEIARADGERETIACDTVVFTGDWTPENSLARAAGIALDPATHGPRVDTGLRTSRPGVFAVGDGVRAAEMADVATLEGGAAAAAVKHFLQQTTWPDEATRIVAAAPLAWIAPNAVAIGTSDVAPRGRFVVRAARFAGVARIEVRQGERLLHRARALDLAPNRSTTIDAAWASRVVPGEDVVVSLAP